MGFVPQDDIVHTELTVREALSFQARLRLGEDHPAQERAEEVVKAITFVGLEAQADQIISTLSGGQRKRVSVATELLNDPKLIFLDEPTSGLDPGLDKRMMLLLRLLADQGRTVILTTHAIAHVDVADQLLLVGPGGWVIYAGPPQEACAWFGVETLADVFALIEDPDAAQAAAQRIPRPAPAEPVHAARSAMPVRPTSRSVGRGQLALFTRRQLLIMRRDLTALLVLLGSGAAVAVIVWLLLNVVGSTGSDLPTWWQQKGASEISIIFGCASVWFGALASVRELVKERPIWRRESLVGANPASYLGSKLFILFMIGTIQSASITVIVSVAFSPTPTRDMPFALGFLVTLLLGFMAGAAMGLIISAVAPSSDRAQSMVPNLLILQFIFSGAAIKLGTGVVWSFGNLIPTRWVVGAIDHLGDQFDCRIGDKCPLDYTNSPQSPPILDVLVAPPIAWLALGLLIVGSSAVVLNLLRRQARSWSIG
jgi:energy-coupling factor transporter ATP-binding protein EcfA2